MVKHQRGVALLMVLVAVTLLASLLYPLWQAQQLAMIRAQASQGQVQAWTVLISAEDWVKSALKLDAGQSSVDSLDELWAQPMPALPFEGGQVSGWLEDAQGRLDINRLGAADMAQREQALAQFNRLCQVLELECPFWPAVADWLDADDVPMAGGMETAGYLGQRPGRRAANQPARVVDELLVVAGVSAAVLARLRPFVVCLPQPVPVNVNTAPPEVLMALSEVMTPERVQALVTQRQNAAFENLTQVSNLLRQSSVQDALINQLVNEREMSVATRFFWLYAQAAYGGHGWSMVSLLQREAGQVRVVMRWLQT